MSKWINKDLFDEFQKEKMEEKEAPTVNFNRSDLIWSNPVKGTVEVPKVYEGRFLPDSKGKFYKKYHYHMWQSGENWIFVLCPKTYDFKAFCPFCSAVNKLYQGNAQDKSQAYNIKRKERFVGNFYVARDSRDEDREDEKKVVGKVKLYEFPSKIEQKLKKEILDTNEGYGYQIFDPGENGRNFIISILSTKPDKNKKQWPDYSGSEFSRRQSALGTESEIDALMETCTDLTEYIDSMEVDKDKQIEILKNEFLWDLVADECIKNGYSDSGSSETPQEEGSETRENPRTETRESRVENNAEDDNPFVDDDDTGDNLDDDELLKELDNM